MANHKRRRPKNARSGCLLCKGWKANGADQSHFSASERRRLQLTEDDLEDTEVSFRGPVKHRLD